MSTCIPILLLFVLPGLIFAADAGAPPSVSSSDTTTPVQLPKVSVSTSVWRDFGFSIGARPKFFLPRPNAKLARLWVGNRVAKDSPGQKAGLRTGDIIEKVDDVPASELTLLDVDRKLFGKKIGDRVVLQVRRPEEKDSREVELIVE